jgi:hypothetical protein
MHENVVLVEGIETIFFSYFSALLDFLSICEVVGISGY